MSEVEQKMSSLVEDRHTKELRKFLTITVCILERNLARQRAIKDPMIRHTLFIEKLSISIDCILGLMESELSTLPEDLYQRIKILTSNIDKDLAGLMDWIQHPIYSPDHPMGSNMMNESKLEFGGYTKAFIDINEAKPDSIG